MGSLDILNSIRGEDLFAYVECVSQYAGMLTLIPVTDGTLGVRVDFGSDCTFYSKNGLIHRSNGFDSIVVDLIKDNKHFVSEVFSQQVSQELSESIKNYIVSNMSTAQLIGTNHYMLSINNGSDIVEFRWINGNGIVYVSIKNCANMPLGGFVISDKIDCVFTYDDAGFRNLKPKALSLLTNNCLQRKSGFGWLDIVNYVKSVGGTLIGSNETIYEIGSLNGSIEMIVAKNKNGYVSARTEDFYKDVDIINDTFMVPLLDVING